MSDSSIDSNPPYLPHEILSSIIQHLSEDQPTLCSLSLVSKSTHTLITPLLWSTLRLSPFSSQRRVLHPPTNWMPYPTVSRVLLDHPYHLKGCIGISNEDDRWINPYKKYVKTIEVESHDPTWCHSWTVQTPPSFPSLQTLRIMYNDDGLASCIHPGYPSRSCRLLEGLSPTSVILDIPSLDGMNPLVLSGSVSRSVKDLTFIFGQRGCLTRHEKCRFDENMMATLTLQTITMVFPPSLSITSDEVEEEDQEKKRGCNSSYLTSILTSFEHSPITIVNAGYNEKMSKGSNHLSMKILDRKGPKMFKKRLDAMCKAEGWSEERIKTRQDSLSFLSMDEWARRSEMWEGKVERDRVLRWKEVMGGV